MYKEENFPHMPIENQFQIFKQMPEYLNAFCLFFDRYNQFFLKETHFLKFFEETSKEIALLKNTGKRYYFYEGDCNEFQYLFHKIFISYGLRKKFEDRYKESFYKVSEFHDFYEEQLQKAFSYQDFDWTSKETFFILEIILNNEFQKDEDQKDAFLESIYPHLYKQELSTAD